MAKHSSATVDDCYRLLHFASTLKRINGDESQSAKKIRVQRKMMALCAGFNCEAHFMGLVIKVYCPGNDETIVRIPS